MGTITFQGFFRILIITISGFFSTYLPTLANAQYIQEWTGPIINPLTNQPQFAWQPDLNSNPRLILDFDNTLAVFLEYNCWYMTAICENAQNWFATQRAQVRPHPRAFAYDFGRRTTRRRQASCPSNWATNHQCPEPNQPPVWRQDGQWYYTALDPVQTPNNVIQHLRGMLNGVFQIVQRSKLRYTCDEFPPATWVEGGRGLANNMQPAETRCAAYRCPGTAGEKIYGEQNWQARAHTTLNQELQRQVINYYGQGVWDKANEPVMFYLVFDNNPTSIPASVILATPQGIPYMRNDLPMYKRDGILNASMIGNDSQPWSDMVDSRRLEDLGFHVTRHDIYTNHTVHTTRSAPRPIHMGNQTESRFRSDSKVSVEWDEGGLQNSTIATTTTFPAVGSNRAVPKAKQVSALLRNATLEDIEAARKMVDAAITESGNRNRERFAHMARNIYRLKPGTIIGGSGTESSRRRRSFQAVVEENGVPQTPPPLFEVTPELAAAAALLAELDATGIPSTNQTTLAMSTSALSTGQKRTFDEITTRATGTFWMETLARKGTVPWGDDPTYKVFRNVKDYGAVGDGKKDDTAAIKRAMNDGNRCGKNCNGSTRKNAIVYFPQGIYLVSSGIPVVFGTQLIGDANNWPTIIAAKSFIGTSVLSTDEYTGGDGGNEQWYVNTASFYRQIRNVRIDVTNTRSAQEVACIHYQVAQATSLQFVELIAKTGTKQRGIVAENGSGGVLADIKFTGGNFGLWGGEQQFTAQRLTFDGCSTAVQVIWDWGWVWKSITVRNSDVGFRLTPEDGSGGHIGSATIMDSSFTNVGTAVLIAPLDPGVASGSTGLVIDNVAFSNVQKGVADTSGHTLLGGDGKVDLWVTGPVYGPEREFYMGKAAPAYSREKSLLDGSGAYFERSKPQYEDRPVGDFVHLKDLGAAGDGATDDTAAFQAALNQNIGKVLFVDAGTYLITRTVVIPPGTKLVGETWSQIAASGPFFSDAKAPKPMLQVGLPGAVGDVELQDLIFTTKGPTAGVILVQWNIKASGPGTAGLWGGASGTSLNPDECPAVTSGVNANCNGGSLMMHITEQASGYFENMWLWVADHMVDDPLLDDPSNPMVQASVYVGRGFLIESTEATWLYGTASEHAVFYQYNFHRARNVFAGFVQTESPYYQPTPKAPEPFGQFVGRLPGDPTYTCDGSDFDGCDSSWAVMIRGCQDIVVASAGLYSWFSTYAQDCIDSQTCQKALLLLENNAQSVRIQNLITIGAKYSIVQDGVGIRAADNLNVDIHPRWSQISLFGSTNNEVLWVDPKIWRSPDPTVWCDPPCILKLPPWTGATSIIDYPLVTVTRDGWTSTITHSPLTVSNWLIEPITIGAAGPAFGAQAEGGDVVTSVWPTFAPTPVWPLVVYQGPDGRPTSTRAAAPAHPPPPALTAPPIPVAGAWPTKALVVRKGAQSPIVGACSYDDPVCNPGYFDWSWSGPSWENMGDDYIDPEELNPEDEGVFCPSEPPTSTSAAPPPAETSKAAPPLSEPSPSANDVHCYDSGAKADHDQLDAAINSFCGQLEKVAVLDPGFFYSFSADQNVRNNQVITILMSVEVKSECEWRFDSGTCRRYLDVPVDSCNCGGVNSKQGGWVENNCMSWRIDPNVIG